MVLATPFNFNSGAPPWIWVFWCMFILSTCYKSVVSFMSHSWWACLIGPWSIYSQLLEVAGFCIFLPSLCCYIGQSVFVPLCVSVVGSGSNLYSKLRWYWHRWKKKKKKKRSGSRKHRNRYRRFRRYAVPFHLVERCRRRNGNRPPTVSKERLQSSPDARHARWRRRKRNSKGRYKLKKWIGFPSLFGPNGYLPNGYVQAADYYSSRSPPTPFKPSELDSNMLDEFVECGNFLDIVPMLNGLPQQNHEKNISELFGRLDEHSHNLTRLYLQLNLHLRCIVLVLLFSTEQMEVLVATTPNLCLLDLTSLTVHSFGTLELLLVSHRSGPTLFTMRKFRYQLRMLQRRIL